MSDRIDPDAIRAEVRERVLSEALALGSAVEYAVNQALEIDALRSREVPDGGWWCTAECDCPCGDESSAREAPDGHVRIDGTLCVVRANRSGCGAYDLIYVEEPS